MRRLSFNLTLFFATVFALGAGGAPNFTVLCTLIALCNVGVGGNLPVDSAVFLEFVPATHQWLTAVLSVWWALGQLVTSLVCISGFDPITHTIHSVLTRSCTGCLAVHRELLLSYYCDDMPTS